MLAELRFTRYVVEMGDIEIFVYDYCEARISRLSQLFFPPYFY